MRIVELTPSVVERAAHLRADYRLRTADALQAGSALSFGNDVVFVTGDAVFTRVPNLLTNILD